MDVSNGDGTKSAFIFGLGYVGTAIAYSLKADGWKVSGTVTKKSSKSAYKASEFRKKGINALFFDEYTMSDMQSIRLAISQCSHLLSTVPPVVQEKESTSSDLVVDAFEMAIKEAINAGTLRWIGYISSTGVYGLKFYMLILLMWCAIGLANQFAILTVFHSACSSWHQANAMAPGSQKVPP